MVIGVIALARFEPLPEGRVRLSIRWGTSPVRLVLTRRGDRWRVVAVDREWVKTVLLSMPDRSPTPTPPAEPPR